MCQSSPFFGSKFYAEKVFCVAFVLLGAAFSQTAAGQTAPEAIALEIGKPVEREIVAKQKHSFQITLAENQAAAVTVEQRGIDVSVRAYNIKSDDPRALAQKDSVLSTAGREEISFLAAAAGVYRLEIEAKTTTAATGGYTVLLTEIRPPKEKELQLAEAWRLHGEAVKFWRAGKFAEATSAAERALLLRERHLGAEELEVATSVANLAVMVGETGDYEKAIGLYQRSINIREKILGAHHLDLAGACGNLGTMYRVVADYAKAEEFLLRALAIREKNLPPDSAPIAVSLSAAARLYIDKNDTDKALEYALRAVAIYEKVSGAEHPNTAGAFDDVAAAYDRKGDYQTAENYYLRSLSIVQKNFPADHPRTATVMGDLAITYNNRGDYAKAEPLLRQTLAAMEKNVGKEHRNYGYALMHLAETYTEIGEYQKAEPMYLEALAVMEKLFGGLHPSVTRILDDLARNHLAKGETATALNLLARSRGLWEQRLPPILATSSERQKLAALRAQFFTTNLRLTAQTKFAPDDAAALELALLTVLQSKGRVSDAMATDFAALHGRFNAEDQILLDKLKNTTAQLARKILNESPNAAPAEYQRQVKELQEKKERLEIEIGRRSSEFRARNQTVTLASIQSAIPENAALLEFGTYSPYDPKLPDVKAYGEPRYVVYIIRRTGKIHWKDLGAAKAIDEAVENFRQSLRDPKSGSVKQAARLLDEKIMQPTRSLTGGAEQLLISPDGALNLIPFEALVEEKNSYLVENYSFAYLTSGRDLLRMQNSAPNNNKSLIVANPLFGEPLELTAKINGKRRGVNVARDLSETYFTPLGATIAEARAIRLLYPDATFLVKEQATESALKQTAAPRLLHIATHGFFLADADGAPTTARGANAVGQVENPLVRSGLALAGANRRDGKQDDGILTALEAANMNLWGTKLVVLSACDTGLGEVRNGEGVYGLRRALTLAGAESLVMSLWSVSDQVTRELMTNYYKHLKAGTGRGASLRQVQLEMLKKKDRAHPFYWAAFIQSGEWANLDGRR